MNGWRDDLARVRRGDLEDDEGGPHRVAPGKRSLTQRLPPRASAQRLPPELTSRLETAGGGSVADVRVHDDPAAHQAARSLGARAFTTGRDIYFAAASYDPSSADGQRLIAHEVAHTVQQQGAGSAAQAKPEVSRPGDWLEREADAFAAAFGTGRTTPLTRGAAAGIQREAEDASPEQDGVRATVELPPVFTDEIVVLERSSKRATIQVKILASLGGSMAVSGEATQGVGKGTAGAVDLKRVLKRSGGKWVTEHEAELAQLELGVDVPGFSFAGKVDAGTISTAGIELPKVEFKATADITDYVRREHGAQWPDVKVAVEASVSMPIHPDAHKAMQAMARSSDEIVELSDELERKQRQLDRAKRDRRKQLRRGKASKARYPRGRMKTLEHEVKTLKRKLKGASDRFKKASGRLKGGMKRLAVKALGESARRAVKKLLPVIGWASVILDGIELVKILANLGDLTFGGGGQSRPAADERGEGDGDGGSGDGDGSAADVGNGRRTGAEPSDDTGDEGVAGEPGPAGVTGAASDAAGGRTDGAGSAEPAPASDHTEKGNSEPASHGGSEPRQDSAAEPAASPEQIPGGATVAVDELDISVEDPRLIRLLELLESLAEDAAMTGMPELRITPELIQQLVELVQSLDDAAFEQFLLDLEEAIRLGMSMAAVADLPAVDVTGWFRGALDRARERMQREQRAAESTDHRRNSTKGQGRQEDDRGNSGTRRPDGTSAPQSTAEDGSALTGVSEAELLSAVSWIDGEIVPDEEAASALRGRTVTLDGERGRVQDVTVVILGGSPLQRFHVTVTVQTPQGTRAVSFVRFHRPGPDGASGTVFAPTTDRLQRELRSKLSFPHRDGGSEVGIRDPAIVTENFRAALEEVSALGDRNNGRTTIYRLRLTLRIVDVTGDAYLPDPDGLLVQVLPNRVLSTNLTVTFTD